jgi:uncharacterized delta-60 repeat protein
VPTWSRRVLIAVAVLGGLVVAPAALPAAGAATSNLGGRVMDFGTNGAMRYAPPRSGDGAYATAVDGLGRIVVAVAFSVPRRDDKGFMGSWGTAALIRFLPDGTRDMSFGKGGRRVLVAPTPTNVFAPNRLVVSADNGVVAFGESGNKPWLVRVTSTGALDSSFGYRGDGWRRVPLPAGSPGVWGSAHMLQRADGRLVVALAPQVIGGDQNFPATRPYMWGFTAAGKTDTTFGSGGYVGPIGTGDLCCTTQVVDVAERPDGGLVLGVEQYYGGIDAGLFGFLADGRVDEKFADHGMLELGSQYHEEADLDAVVVHPSGKITAQEYDSLQQWLPDGAPDPTFGTNGRMNSGGGGLRMLADGENTVELYGNSILRRLADGSYDPAFGTGYGAYIDGAETPDQRYPGAIIVDFAFRPGGVPGQRPLVVAGDQADVVLFALTGHSGAHDPAFGDDGIITVDMSHFGATVLPSASTGDGQGGLFVGGTADKIGAVVHVDASGKPDPNFGVGGIAVFPRLGTVNRLLRDDAGRITVVGYDNGYVAVTRLTANGQTDPAFHGGTPVLLQGLVEYGFPTTVAALQLHDGRILVVGWTKAAVITVDGQIDPALGVYDTALPGRKQLVPRGDGYLLMALDWDYGRTPWRVTVRAESSPGVTDPTFGENGTTYFDQPTGVNESGDLEAFATSKGIVVHAGEAPVFRFLTTGELDPTLSIPQSAISTIAVQPDGHIIVLTGNAARRYSDIGVLDNGFGNHGVIGVGMGLDTYFTPLTMLMSGTRVYFVGQASDVGSPEPAGMAVIARDSRLTGGVAQMSVPSRTVFWEGQHNTAVTLHFDRSPDVPVTYEYIAESGTANVPGDAGPSFSIQQIVNHGPPTTTTPAPVSIVDDSQSEPDEYFSVHVTRSDFALVTADRGQVVIRDNDRAGSGTARASANAYGTFAGGAFVAAGDVDGDGKAEVVTGADAGGGPVVRVLAGATLSNRVTFAAFDGSSRAGVRVAVADVDGDARGEVIVSQGSGAQPRVNVFKINGSSATLYASFLAYASDVSSGVAVARADIDGDGRDEIVTAPGPGAGPHVRVWSLDGAGNATERIGFMAYAPSFTGGLSVAAFDYDGDGRDEIATGAGPGGGPHVQVFTLANGRATPVVSFMAYDPNFTGGVMVGGGRISGYATEELLTAAGAGGGPHVAVSQFPPGTRRVPYQFMAYEQSFTGGARVAAGDVDGDGRSEVITTPGPGRAADVVVRGVTL